MYYIYAYIDPRTNLPFYIGKGKDNRKFDHLSENQSKKENKDKFQVIQELQLHGLKPLIVELESNIESELMAYNREDYYILQYGRKGFETNGILTNKTIGGKHPPTPVWTTERKKLHSDWNKSYWTQERKQNHNLVGSLKTVSVTDQEGHSKRIPMDEYNNIDKSGPINTWKYVSVSSKESRRRKESP